MNWAERKKSRTERFEKYVKGWKLRRCTACSGSGYYDSNGSPPCGACDGTGKERVSPERYKEWIEYCAEHNIKVYR